MSQILDKQAEIARGRLLLEKALDGDTDIHEILLRYDRYASDLWDGLVPIYDGSTLLPELISVIAEVHKGRSARLRERDQRRILEPDWFQSEKAIGYVCYTDLFAGNLKGIESKIDYLKSLGVTYLHLMPLLAPRQGANDGGYAVMNYKAVRKDLGTMEDLASLTKKLHDHGISLTLDLVLNHVAKEHDWAEKAKAGESKYRDYFYVYNDRKIPDEFEKTLPEVFPTFAPGNFTFDKALNGWVWTTFNEYQWDVNWTNSEVFLEYNKIIGFLANQGTDCVRLDAIAFIWKRLGTNSQNQPEVHAITQALRMAAKIYAPSLVFKAEAIVGPQEVVHYLGQREHSGKVSDLAYNNSLMVQIWSALAARDGRLLTTALSRFAPIPTTTSWATYLRCHDDIGWAIDDADANLAGVSGPMHRNFLAEFYANEFKGSFARGVHFQSNPTTGDKRTSGSAASLAGIEMALEKKDSASLATAIDRLICAYAMIFGFGGIPLLYMGDELGMLNDRSYLKDPTKAEDSRWIHRPKMNWEMAERAKKGSSVEAQVFARIVKLIHTRKSLPSLHAAVSTEVFTPSNSAILIFRRKHSAGEMVQIYNLSEQSQGFDSHGILSGMQIEHISGEKCEIKGWIQVPAYATWWFTAAN